MAAQHIDALALAQTLIRCPSVTPDEGGALDALEAVLAPAGFTCHRLPFSEDGTPDVDNLFARVGADGPHLCFAGHTDVVPPGDEALGPIRLSRRRWPTACSTGAAPPT